MLPNHSSVVEAASGLSSAPLVACELTYVARETGVEHTVELSEAVGLDLVETDPVRAFPAFFGQRRAHVTYYAATNDRSLPAESRLEASNLMLADYDPQVTGLATQPFRLRLVWQTEEYKHTPDFVASRSGLCPLVVDVLPADQLEKEHRVKAAAASRYVCEELGCEYAIRCEPPQVLLENVRLLAGYRREPMFIESYAPAFVDACAAGPRRFEELAALFAGDPFALPVLFHLLWRHTLELEVTAPFRVDSLIWRENH